MALYFIGLGLADEKDITLKGLELVGKSDFVYLENYTGILPSATVKRLERLFGKRIIPAGRELVEGGSEILKNSKKRDVAFLVVGDSLSATTHVDLFLRAKKERIKTDVIHNASIFSAVAITGLQLYKFGRTTSVPFPQQGFEPESFYDAVKLNLKSNLHTLLLLDLNPKENRFMAVRDAVDLLLKIEDKRKEKVLSGKTFAVGCARIGSRTQKIKFGALSSLKNTDFGKPPFCLIIPAKLHFVEEEMLQLYD